MNEHSSRSDERQERLYLLAQKHELVSEEILYPSEAKRLLRDGFKVEKLKDFDASRNLGVYNISWSNPYPDGIPHIVFSYCKGLLSVFPKNKVTNFAQELYIIASKRM